MATATAAAQRIGKVVQVIGPVIDIEFTGGLPEIYNAVRIVSEGGPGIEKIDVVAEVEQHLGENRVRAVAMKATDGMTRGMTVLDTTAPISVPVGPETLGRVLNVLGEPVDYPDRPVQAVASASEGRQRLNWALRDRAWDAAQLGIWCANVHPPRLDPVQTAPVQRGRIASRHRERSEPTRGRTRCAGIAPRWIAPLAATCRFGVPLRNVLRRRRLG